jgi:glycine/D-amino acid oxidase-like deaminating enzyme
VDESPPYTPLPPLQRDETADVVIIGGGFTGVSTAWHLSQRFADRRIVLLEAKQLATGASGRNGGQALNWINGIEVADPERARRIYEVTRSGIDLIEDVVTRCGVEAGFDRRGCLEVYTSARGAETAHARVEFLRSAGVPVEWVDGAASGVAAAHGAVRDPSAARVNGAALLRGLRPTLLAHGVALYEQTPVLRLDEGATIRLTTPQGTVRAAAVVLATNAYTPRLGYFADRILPLHSHVIATAPLSDELWSALGWSAHHGFSDDLDRIAYGCRTAAGRLVFGGGGNDAYAYLYGGQTAFPPASPRAAASFAALERHLRAYFPAAAAAPITHRWSGTLDLTFDRVCSMGVRGEHANVYYALGYSGHGIALGMLAGRVLCDLYSGNHAAWRDMPFYQRPMPRLPPEPLRWLGYQIYTRLTGRSPRRR